MILDQIMSRSVVTIEARASVLEARELLRKHRIHHLVAVDHGRVVGVVSFRALIGKKDTEKVFEAMSRDFSVATPQTTMRDAAAMMIGRSVGCLPVVQDGRIAGIITTSDLLKLLNGTATAVA